MKKNIVIKLLLVFLFSFVVVFGVGFVFIDNLFNEFVEERQVVDHPLMETSPEEEETDVNLAEVKQLEKETENVLKESINILVFGTDESGFRSDTAILLHYNPKSKSTCIFSVPRDYRIDLSKETQKLVKAPKKFLKFTEFFSYAKMSKQGSPASLSTKIVEELLSIKIDHFVVVDISGFRKAVDVIGGVEVYVPQNMVYYDRVQEFRINLKKGYQLLDGKKAEQLMRYRKNQKGRGYQDIGRMQMQQYFLTAYIKKLFSLESVGKIDEIVKKLSDVVKTDAKLTDALFILNSVRKADFNKVDSYQLPGKCGMIGKKSYVNPSPKSELRKFYLNAIINNSKEGKIDSKSFEIDVYGVRKSLSKEAKALVEKLNADGYTATYKGTRGNNILKTKIIVPNSSVGYDLKKYVNLSEIEIDEKLKPKDKTGKIIIQIGKLQNSNEN